MADLILSPIADTIIGSLGSAAVREIATLWGVNDELEQLQNTISLIKAVLLDAEKKQVHDNSIRNWLTSLADAVHDADDLMDEFETEARRRQLMDGSEFAKNVCTFFSSSNQLAFRHKLGRKIQEIRKKLASASNNRSFLLREVLSPDEKSEVVPKRDTHSFVPQEEVIGRAEEREEIVKLLLDCQFQESLPVIPVVGMGGLGKTTLVQSVFNDERVKQYFEIKTWVCISVNFDLEVILQKITNESQNVELDQLQQSLRKMLGGKRYLLVLDDVWEENREKWLELKNLLIGGAEGSRVVVTTRSRVVASATSLVKPYQLGILDEEKSWSLFKKMAFRQSEEEKSPNLVQIGKEIADRCGGIPLAIRVIGSTLYCKHSESEWTSFANKISKISREGSILPTLKLSYDNLDSQLKQCFAYCRLFPKDYDFDVRMLIQLWMAQGFLKRSDARHDECLEDVGYCYFTNLLERSFFQEVKIDYFGVAETCKMHDFIHDLAIEVAGQEYATGNWGTLAAMSKNVRHLSIDSQSPISTSVLQPRNMRTILFLRRYYFATDEENTFLDAAIPKLKKLRTLDARHSFLGNTVPECVSRLKHVRYLDLSFNKKVKTLPNSITNLINLQTLKLSSCSQLQELPKEMKKLVNLIHLELDGCDGLRHMPAGLGQLTNLITLSKFVLPVNRISATKENGELRELMPLNKLRRRLRIVNLKHGDADVEFGILKEKKDLQFLSLEWEETNDADIDGREMSLEGLQPHPNLLSLHLKNYRVAKFPNWLHSLANLVRLSISDCGNCKFLCPMTQFHNLKELDVNNLPSLEYMTEWSTSHDLSSSSPTSLPSLERLSLFSLPNLKGWWRDYAECGEENQLKPLPSFPQLTELRIDNCPYLKCMPLYPHLEKLRLTEASWKPFQQTMLESSSSISPLSKLRYLQMGEIEGVECLPEWFKGFSSLQELNIHQYTPMVNLRPGILHLTSLKVLRISSIDLDLNNVDEMIIWKALNGRLEILSLESFSKLETLPQGISHLTSLQRLYFEKWEALVTIPEWIGNLSSLESLMFSDCEKLMAIPESIGNLSSLESLWFIGCEKLMAIPESIGNLSSLERLEFIGCEKLMAIPESIGNLSSLRILLFARCSTLASLPEGIRRLTSLQTLNLSDSPVLIERCQPQIGIDWPKISHIPNVRGIIPKVEEPPQKKWKLLEGCLP